MAENFYVVAREQGCESEPLPTWADRGTVGVLDALPPSPAARIDIDTVPGAFQLTGVLSVNEADRLVELAESLGFHQDAPVSLPHRVRHNDNVNWVVSEAIDAELWRRCKTLFREKVNGQTAQGLNARFRFYRYRAGDFFQPHSDGAWPGSRVIQGRLVANAYPNLLSQYSFILFLSDAYQGGRTQFLVTESEPLGPARSGDDMRTVDVATPKGAALCFPHGMHPQHCLHAGEPVAAGAKYIIRTDVLFG